MLLAVLPRTSHGSEKVQAALSLKMRCLSLELLKEVNLAVTCAVLRMPLGPTTHPVQLMYIVSITFLHNVFLLESLLIHDLYHCQKGVCCEIHHNNFEVSQGSASIRGTVCRPERPVEYLQLFLDIKRLIC